MGGIEEGVVKVSRLWVMDGGGEGNDDGGWAKGMHTPLVAVRTLLRGHLLYPLVIFCKVLF